MDWCLGKYSPAFNKFFQIIEQWAVRTYEGKKVTLGFVINPRAKSAFPEDTSYGTWFEFINDDYAATLSDCIHSVIELDGDCSFSRYLSITEGGVIDEYTLSDNLPYRFARVIDKYVRGDCIGVFLLNNGDIILSKNGAIKLIKRNLKWLNFSFEAFKSAVITKKKLDISLELLKHIYASTLDVSFSHTGGIISVISDINQLSMAKSGSAPILNGCDNLLNGKDLLALDSEMKEDPFSKKLSNAERKKRLLKRKAIMTLVNGKSFLMLDRKLRAELISMDGACIMNASGDVYSFGAIIQNDSGSAGGGRSAAAKKLSNYGMAVKISTDGYIELFINGESVYAVK